MKQPLFYKDQHGWNATLGIPFIKNGVIPKERDAENPVPGIWIRMYRVDKTSMVVMSARAAAFYRYRIGDGSGVSIHYGEQSYHQAANVSSTMRLTEDHLRALFDINKVMLMGWMEEAYNAYCGKCVLPSWWIGADGYPVFKEVNP